MGVARAFRQETFAAEGEGIPRNGVMERQDRCEDAGDEQQPNDSGVPAADVGVGKGEQKVSWVAQIGDIAWYFGHTSTVDHQKVTTA
jgi:hypothetical protein